MKTLPRRLAALLALALLASSAVSQDVGAFRLELPSETFDAPFTGELFVAFVEPDGRGEPRQAMHGWFGAPPVLRFEVQDAGGELLVSPAEAAAWFPLDWTEVAARSWRVQAIARVSRTGRQAGLSAGDVYSDVVEILYDPSSSAAVELRLEHVVAPTDFPETERVRLFEFVSPSLSKFHGFEYTMRAGVLLPRTYGDRDSYPVLYSVTGFGGTHTSILGWEGRVAEGSPLDECIIVVPDASNLYGHSVFCDSDSIGPWGQALVHELIPALEAEFGGAGARQRYTTGVSSGGWSSLWLQVAYPEEFAGCWSHVPDPIDFYDFQQINLYEPLPDGTPRNMYVDESGEPRGLARNGETVMLTYEDFVRRENVLNPGGQIRSFEGTFSPLGDDGTPRRVFDVETGAIDHEAAQAWREYDISDILLTRWDELRESLAGKIHVYAGGMDTFYLEGAVERFMVLADKAGILDEMVVEVIPGMPHSLHQPGQEDMVETIEARRLEVGLD
jgi:hypothetical protein